MKISWECRISPDVGPETTVGDSVEVLPPLSLAVRRHAIRLLVEQFLATLERDLLKDP